MCDSSNTKSQKLSNQEHVARFNKYIEGFPQSSPKSWSDQPSFSSRNLSHSATSTALLSSNPTLSQFNMPQTGKHPEPVAPLDTNLDLNSLPVEPEDPPRFANSIPQFFREIRALFPLNDGGHLEHRNDPPNTSSHSQPQSGNQRFEGGAIQASSGTHTQGLHMKHVKDDSFPIPTKKHIILGDPDSPTFRLQPPRIRADRMPRKRKFDLAMYDDDSDDLSVSIEIPPRPQFEKCRRKIVSNKRIKRTAKNDAKNDASSSNPSSTINRQVGLKAVVNPTDEEDPFPLPYVYDGHVWRLRDSGPMEGWQVIPGKLALHRQNKKILKQVRTGDERRRDTNRKNKNEGEETK